MVGGGHTLAVVHELNLTKKISYVSTAGGALMDYLTGKKLPAVEALKEAATRYRKGA
jgi:phosphoglycerate kinase